VGVGMGHEHGQEKGEGQGQGEGEGDNAAYVVAFGGMVDDVDVAPFAYDGASIAYASFVTDIDGVDVDVAIAADVATIVASYIDVTISHEDVMLFMFLLLLLFCSRACV
jgi:hypothetical protein